MSSSPALAEFAGIGAAPALRSSIAAVAAGIVVFGLPFAAYTSLVLHHFYIQGAFFWDSGLLAYLMSQPDPSLPMPPYSSAGSYLGIHFTPIFIALSLIRRLLNVSDAQFFAGFCGFCQALPGLAVFRVLHAGFRLRTPVGSIAAATIAVAFSFNGLALAIARYPHFEMLIVGSMMLFFAALVERKWVIAGLCAAICLVTREDAGFHLFALLSLLILLNRHHGVPWREQRPEIAVAVTALAYSLLALALQHAIGGGHSFEGVYLGDNPFATIGFGVLAERLLGYVQYRGYLVVPALIALWWAGRTRNPYVALGYAAFLPWGTLHLLAYSNNAGTLSGYYAFPFMIAAFWPLIGTLLGARAGRGRGSPVAAIAFFSLMIAGSFTSVSRQYNPGHLAFPVSFVPPSAARQAATDRAVMLLTRWKGELGAVLVDQSVLALAPAGYAPSESVGGNAASRPDAVVYFEHGYDAATARSIAAGGGLDHLYEVPDTEIRVAADRAIPAASPLTGLLVPTRASR